MTNWADEARRATVLVTVLERIAVALEKEADTPDIVYPSTFEEEAALAARKAQRAAEQQQQQAQIERALVALEDIATSLSILSSLAGNVVDIHVNEERGNEGG